MDLMIQSESFRLGVKRSTILLPWEKPPLSDICDAELKGKLTWSRVTSVIPWPVVQERSLSRVLENWRIILCDNLEASDLGRQIRSILDGTESDVTVEQVIRDSLARRAVSTLRSRSSSLMAFARWKKAEDLDATIFPVTEEEAYCYVVELRQLGADKSVPLP